MKARCVFCLDTYAMTVDHLIPKSKGGIDEKENRFPCCRPCNQAKQSHLLRGITMAPVAIDWTKVRAHVRKLRRRLDEKRDKRRPHGWAVASGSATQAREKGGDDGDE